MATPEESLMVAARRMADQGASDLVVVEELKGETHPVGMVSEHDLVRALARGSIPPDVIKDVMRTDVVTVGEDDDLDAALATLSASGARTAPVVDREFRVQGVLGLDALLAARRPTSGLGRALGGGLLAGAFAGVMVAALATIAIVVRGGDPRDLLARDTIGLELSASSGLAMFWGVMFGLFAYGLGRAATLFAGLVWGVVAWLGMAYVALPMLEVAAPPVPQAMIAFGVFGVLVAVGFAPFQRTLPSSYSGQ